MPTLRPIADVSAIGWTSTAGSVSDAVNEVSPSDGSYASSPIMAGPEAFVYDFSLASIVPAGSQGMSVRARRTGNFGQIRVAFLDDTDTVVGTAAWQDLGNSFAQHDFVLTTVSGATRGRVEVRATERNSLAVDGVEVLIDGEPIIFT